jgi:hypothetical protein
MNWDEIAVGEFFNYSHNQWIRVYRKVSDDWAIDDDGNILTMKDEGNIVTSWSDGYQEVLCRDYVTLDVGDWYLWQGELWQKTSEELDWCETRLCMDGIVSGVVQVVCVELV